MALTPMKKPEGIPIVGEKLFFSSTCLVAWTKTTRVRLPPTPPSSSCPTPRAFVDPPPHGDPLWNPRGQLEVPELYMYNTSTIWASFSRRTSAPPKIRGGHGLAPFPWPKAAARRQAATIPKRCVFIIKIKTQRFVNFRGGSRTFQDVQGGRGPSKGACLVPGSARGRLHPHFSK
jgi:hypothetical protein